MIKFSTYLAAFAIANLTSIAIADLSFAAATFEEQKIDSDKIIAIARPYGNNKYDLLTIEQIPRKKQCWRENGSNPTSVEPLLLKFDFTGHCNRSTDSNGYSMRVGGKDYGLDYLLRIVQRNGELVLLGTPRANPQLPEVTIGRTYGMKAGFLKIILNPGWQFSKRTYQGKVLAHVYFSGDRSAMNSTESNTNVAATPPKTGDRQSSTSPSNTIPDKPVSTRSNHSSSNTASNTNREITFKADSAIASSTSRRLPSSLSSPTSSSSTSNSLTSRRLPSSLSSPSSILPKPTAIPSGKTPNRDRTDTSKRPTLQETLTSRTAPPNVDDSSVVPRPTASAKPNSESTLSDVMSVSSRPLPGSTSVTSESSSPASNYKVLVDASNDDEQKQLKSVYPDAFRTIYQGKSMWQVGIFTSWDNADKAIQDLKDLGLEGVILE
jgi:hypothetical protein